MKRLVAGLIALATLAFHSACAQYIPFDVDFAETPASYELKTSVGNTPTLRVNYFQNGVAASPAGWTPMFKWAKNESAVDGMVAVVGTNGASYSDFFCLTNTFGMQVKDGYFAFYLTRSNGAQNLTVARGRLNVAAGSEVGSSTYLNPSRVINWSILSNTGELPWLSYIASTATDITARAWATGASNLALEAYAFGSNVAGRTAFTGDLHAASSAGAAIKNMSGSNILVIGIGGGTPSAFGGALTINGGSSVATANQWHADTDRIGSVASNALAGIPSLVALSNGVVTVGLTASGALQRTGGTITGVLALASRDSGAETSWGISFIEQAGQSNHLRSVGGRLRVQGIDGDFELLRDDAVTLEGAGNAITNLYSSGGTIVGQRGTITGGGGGGPSYSRIFWGQRWEGSVNGGWAQSFGPGIDDLSTDSGANVDQYAAFIYTSSATAITNELYGEFAAPATNANHALRVRANQPGGTVIFTAMDGNTTAVCTQIIAAAGTTYTTNVLLTGTAVTNVKVRVIYSTTNAANVYRLGIGR